MEREGDDARTVVISDFTPRGLILRHLPHHACRKLMGELFTHADSVEEQSFVVEPQ